MTKTKLYTVILNYRGGVYIGQAAADSATAAMSEWLSKIEGKELLRWGTTRQFLSSIVTSGPPVPLDGCINTWCLSDSTKHGLALLNIIATDQSS